MENHCIEEPFIIRSYRKSELAHLYNPDMPLVPAMRKMRYWIQRNPELYHFVTYLHEVLCRTQVL